MGDMHEKNQVGGIDGSNLRSRRFNDAGEATKEIFDGFNKWSTAVGTYGIQSAYALIAANWAVYGGVQGITDNQWAKWSIIVVIIFLGLNLIATLRMAHLYGKRCDYANIDKNRWENEFNAEAEAPSPWPYTSSIENLGDFIRHLKVWAPVLSGIFFIIGLF